MNIHTQPGKFGSMNTITTWSLGSVTTNHTTHDNIMIFTTMLREAPTLSGLNTIT